MTFNYLSTRDVYDTLDGTRIDTAHVYVTKFATGQSEQNPEMIYFQLGNAENLGSVWFSQEEFDDLVSRLVELNQQYKAKKEVDETAK